jgi:hypothetical protein
MPRFRLEKAELDERWDEMIVRSPQGTIFSMSWYLKSLNRRLDAYRVFKGDDVRAWLVMPVDSAGKIAELDVYTIYGGIGFLQEDGQKNSSALHERFDVTEFLLKKLEEVYEKVSLALSPSFDDLRPFLWHRYGETGTNLKFTVALRYTTYVNIGELRQHSDVEDSDLFMNIDTDRKQHIRKAAKESAVTHIDENSHSFVTCYSEMMSHQGSPVDETTLSRMQSVLDALSENQSGVCLTTYNSTHTPIYRTVFCWDQHRAYYLFGSTPQGAQEKYRGTEAVWAGLKWLAENTEIEIVDLEGVNSPKRGRFKTGFGGKLVSYSEVTRG